MWLSTKTDCVDTELKYWNSSLNNLGHNSWFTVKQEQFVSKQENLYTTYLQSQPSLWQGIMEEKLKKTEEKEKPLNVKKETTTSDKLPAGITRSLRFYPIQEQKQKLKKWFGTVRWTYNRCVNAVKKKQVL